MQTFTHRMIAGLIFLGFATCALATPQHPQTHSQAVPPSLDVITILKNVEAAGYVGINEIKLEQEGYYTVTAFTKAGVKTKLLIDTATGKVPTPSKTKHISIVEAAQKVEAAGYHDITLLKLKKEHFDVNALNSKNHAVKLRVDPITGIVTVR